MFNNRIVVRGVHYTLQDEIGHGLHSIVYGGHDLDNGQSVAIKVTNLAHGSFHSKAGTESRRQSFWKEIDMLLYLQALNPYVIRIFNYDNNDQYGTIVMELGKTFRDTLLEHVHSRIPIPPFLIHRFWSQMVEAIYYLHRIGIVHGDCKPENFIQVGPDETSLRLIDMGISFQLPPNVTSHIHTAAGTPDYVSPEMVNSRIGLSSKSKYGYKADIWALGVILYEMAFGVRPLHGLGSNATKLSFLGQLQRNISIPNHPDKNLRDILKRCLRSNPRRRPNIEQLLNHRYLAG
ncbi:unnamed protein product [Rotaria sordida]|uniref:Protein kinase domain-containing protein n=1 Tax=Rotaria sordida TaxID=392033 RepID=A0A813NKC3_9BILA|nr:unnamed protein product [Rotaria sordida]